MKTTAAKWILVSAGAALIAASAQAAQWNPHDSRHPDPRGRGDYSRHQRPHPGYYGRPAPQPPVAYWGYYPPPPPPPPPMVYYYPPPPPPPPPVPVFYYPVRPGFNITLTF